MISTKNPITQTLNRIIGMSIDTYYNPYKMFQWPDELPEEQWWMSRELMTVHGSALEKQLKRTVDFLTDNHIISSGAVRQ